MKYIITLFLCIVLLLNIASAQQDIEPKYDVSFDMKTLVYHTYRFTENVKVTRVFEDSTINKYEKSVTYWFNIFIPAEKDKNGFLMAEISTDSMKYKIQSPLKQINYSTQDFDAEMPIDDLDFLNSFLSNNQSFNFTYSSYGDVAKVGGETLLEERKIHSAIEDEEKRKFLINALSDDVLTFKYDIAKGVYPSFEAVRDTTWNSENELIVNGIPVSGIFNHKFIGFSNNEYQIDTKMEDLSLRSPLKNIYIPDLNKFANIESAVSTGTMVTNMYTGGTVKYNKVKSKTLIEGKIDNLKYKEVVVSDYTWDLLSRFSY